MGGIFGGGNSYAGGGQDAYNQQQPIYDYGNLGPSGLGDAYTGAVSGDYGGGGDYGAYTSYGGGMGSPTDPGAGYYDVGGGGTAPGGGGGILDWLGSEKGQRALQQLGGFSSGMLAGSAPSLQPRNFATGLGAGMAGFQQAGSQYYQDALHRAQATKAGADVENLQTWSKIMQDQAAQATGLPPGYTGMPPVGGGAGPAQAPAGAGGDAPGTGPFSQVAPIIAKYESGNRHNIGWGGTDLSGVPLSDTGFPQWGGKPGPAGNSTAAGLYQITRSTWDPIARELGIKDFSPESQYKVAEALYQRRGLAPWAPYNPRLAQALGRGEAGEAGAKDPALQVRLPIPSAPGATPAQRLADTPFQAPPSSTLGASPQQITQALGGGAPGLGILPPPPAVPAATQPGAAPPLVAGGGGRIAPVVTQPEPATVAAAAPEAAPVVAEGAGNLATVNRNLKNDANYYRDKLVLIQPTGGKLEKLPAQIDRIKEAGGQPVLQAAADSNAKQNAAIARIAAKKGVPYRGPGESASGGLAPGFTRSPTGQILRNGQPADTYMGGPVPGGGTVPAWRMDAAPVVDTGQAVSAGGGGEGGGGGGEEGLTAGRLIPGIRTPAEVAAAPPAPAPAPAIAAGPTAPPSPPPAPGATVAPPVPAGPAPAAATGPGAMPAPPPVERAPTLPVPNLGQIQPPGMGGIPPYDVNAARRAQILSIAGAATGRTVPGYLTEQANLPNKAIEQQWAQQKELYGAQLQAARDQWKAMNDAQQAQVAAQNGLTKSGYESALREREKNLELGRMWDPQAGRYVQIPGAAEAAAGQEGAIATARQEAERQRVLDTPVKHEYIDESGTPRTAYLTPRQLAAGAVPGAPMPPGATPPAAPVPGAAAPAGAPPPPVPGAIVPQGAQTGLSEPAKVRIDLHKSAASEARQIAATGQRLAPILDEIIRIADKTPQGMAGPIGAALAARVSALGFPVSESLTNAELMRSLSQQLIPTVRQPGAQSNAEMAVYALAVPGLQQSAIGRLQIAHLNRAMIDRANEIANLREDNIGAADLNQKLTALHNKPLFTDEQRAIMHAGTGRRVTDDATFDALPIGMPFVNAKGEHTIKKANRTPAQ